MRTSIGIFKDKAGIFKEDRYVPILEAIINLGSSIILVKYFGLVGIFIGTTISTICCPLWNQPRLVYKKLFKKPLSQYFKSYIVYAIVTIVIGVVTTLTCSMVQINNPFLSLIIKGIICVVVINCSYLIIFSKTKEMKYIYSIIIPIINKLKNKIVINV